MNKRRSHIECKNEGLEATYPEDRWLTTSSLISRLISIWTVILTIKGIKKNLTDNYYTDKNSASNTCGLPTRHLRRFRRIFSTFRTQYILMKYNGNIPSFKWRPKKSWSLVSQTKKQQLARLLITAYHLDTVQVHRKYEVSCPWY